MKKIGVLIIVLCIGLLEIKAQNNKMPDELWQYAKAAKPEIASSCTGLKKNIKITYYENDWSINRVTERIKMKIKVSWDGTISDYTYWVIGYLTCDLDGCNAKFTKIEKNSILISCDDNISFSECLE